MRAEARAWLEESLSGEFAHVRGLGGPGREHEGHQPRQAWERHLGKAGWTCLAWPERYGGRAASLEDQVAFHEEYARADAPARVGLIGEGLIGPTILEVGT
ncbi:acyl-CoA dehydrogenase family protein, partial [Streptomyces sp. NRRL F-6674]|uniref:acyl-CoA dehydrogenase family protein n=1 Tax=Streptomyces sp. NRRL F-6674 TaxID=1463877 RepID=UPI0018FEA4AB